MLWPSLPQGPTVYQQQRHLLLSLMGPASVSSFPVRATMSCFTVSRGSAGFAWTRESWPLYPRKIEDVFSTCSHHHLLGTRFWDSTRLFWRGWYRPSGQGVSVYSTLVSCPWGHAKEQYRIDLDILDNFDVIKKTDPETAAQAEGQPGLLSLVARHAYAEAATAPKKICLCQKTIAEVQGAIVDGFLGVAYPKPMKVGLYVCLALELLRRACYTVAVLFTFACSGAPFCLP